MAGRETRDNANDAASSVAAAGSDTPLAHGASCTVFQHAIEFIGRRWNGAILFVLLDGPYRFNELLARVPNISDRLLTERLRELETAGMVAREVQPGPPVRVIYQLTDAGRSLNEVIQSISSWAERWMPDARD